jgi:acetyl-CoA/propionyl-CoA carboxylase biotin carboxyl carrier protein
VVEAMKMEHTLTAPRAGDLSVVVAVGDKVTSGQRLATIIDHPEGNPT